MRRCLIALVALLSVLTACTSIDCPVEHTVRTLYVLKKSGERPDTLKDTLYIVSKRINKTDTLLVNGVINVPTLSVPISYTSPEDTLYFYFRNGMFQATDVVLIKKDNLPHFESVDCNASFFHRITGVRYTSNAIDSIRINNPSVTYEPTTEHLHLYLKAHN